jgi:hypothetical protein
MPMIFNFNDCRGCFRRMNSILMNVFAESASPFCVWCDMRLRLKKENWGEPHQGSAGGVTSSRTEYTPFANISTVMLSDLIITIYTTKLKISKHNRVFHGLITQVLLKCFHEPCQMSRLRAQSGSTAKYIVRWPNATENFQPLTLVGLSIEDAVSAAKSSSMIIINHEVQVYPHFLVRFSPLHCSVQHE